MNSISKVSLLNILEKEIRYYVSLLGKDNRDQKLTRSALNTTIECVYVYDLLDKHNFKKGNIYNVINGRLILPNGSTSHTVFERLEQVNESFYAYFKEIKEDTYEGFT